VAIAKTTSKPPSARERLLAAALQRFARDGALAATLDEIRVDAGVSVGALYHHFADKSALAGALYVETLHGYQDGFVAVLEAHPDAEGGVRGAVGYTFAWCGEHPAEARLLFGGKGTADAAALAAINRDFLSRVGRWYAGHAHYRALRVLDLALVSSLWMGPTLDHLHHRLAAGDTSARDTAVSVLSDAAWQTLRKPST
jgi:AcrR family transcriptional regulator